MYIYRSSFVHIFLRTIFIAHVRNVINLHWVIKRYSDRCNKKNLFINQLFIDTNFVEFFSIEVTLTFYIYDFKKEFYHCVNFYHLIAL